MYKLPRKGHGRWGKENSKGGKVQKARRSSLECSLGAVVSGEEKPRVGDTARRSTSLFYTTPHLYPASR
ncbi:hypothetical protein BDR06DRAFT_959812 [Suillus hirtellus]|nr:hypothetical protein BDR06DRAFT_959812 [Suillus hirtellus]